jgi:uncharacterized membrane protein YccF (DUF307 family)
VTRWEKIGQVAMALGWTVVTVVSVIVLLTR